MTTKSIRIVYDSKEPSFRERLEEEAKDALKDTAGQTWGVSAIFTIRREIALTLDHIQSQRSLETTLTSELSQAHFYTYRELVQQKREAQYSPFRPNSIDNLKARLSHIESERRILARHTHEVLSRFHSRLLELLNYQTYLQKQNGN